MFHETIIAPATPVACSALAVLRMTGSQSVFISDKLLQLFSGKLLKNSASRTLHLAHLVDPSQKQEKIDELMVVKFLAPNSYTGEDLVEFHCHGSPVIVDFILEKTVELGASLAEPGEFTKRAFLLGKKDLMQAEAVADLIHSKSRSAAQRLVRQVGGDLSLRVRSAKDSLESLLLYLEAELDFSQEQIDFLSQNVYSEKLSKIISDLEALEASFKRSKSLSNDITLVFAGKPNVGKSSLFNAFLRKNRAIVSNVPGTTRDVVDAAIVFADRCVRLVDTAGLRETVDSVEKIGVQKTSEEVKKADVIFFVLSGSSFEEEDRVLWGKTLAEKSSGQRLFVLVNKKDCLQEDIAKSIQKMVAPFEPFFVSALNWDSLFELEEKLKFELRKDLSFDEDVFMLNQRQIDFVKEALTSLREALDLTLDFHQEILVTFLKEALESLSALLGEEYDKDILKKFFANFCIGK
ncbi:tRNA uridine-5-carboxymethylaminomethyl(34) synthesis GTPase MnmE [PVC group bacterium (ex Bugula neritina AB1)]|nr:tRNA uridine-5-carboxymethylaminomethyl(34) synthesis GTPase MnmE [PVC group bacterium (ex Bugula neritina AB1)]